MLSIDPPDEEDSDDGKTPGGNVPGRNTPTPAKATPRVPPMTIRIGEDGIAIPKDTSNEDSEIAVEQNEESTDGSVRFYTLT